MRLAARTLLVAGVLGTAVSLALAVETIAVLTDPGRVPTCSINPVLSCGSVMRSPQAHVLGAPNSLIGVVAFPVIAMYALGLLSGADFSRLVVFGVRAGATAGLLFAHWLMFESLYRLRTLCLYCAATWVITVVIFCYSTLFAWSGESRSRLFLGRYHTSVVAAWIVLIAAFVVHSLWDFWF